MSKKLESLDRTLTEIRKQFGDESVMTLKENRNLDVVRLPSGSLKIDKILGGGLPMGRIVEIYGPEQSGKTTLTLHIVAEAQKAYPNKVAAFIDAEHSLDPVYAESVGVDLERLIINQPDSGEQGLDIAEALLRSGDVSVVVVDSVDALTPLATLNGEMGDRHIAPLARLMSQALRKLASVVQKSGGLMIFANQIREKVGMIYGNPEVTPGGRALKFYTTQRIEIRRKGKPQDSYVEAKVKCVKNKVSRPFLEDVIQIEYGKGILDIGEIIDMSVEYDIIDKAGSWYKNEDESLKIQGRVAFMKKLQDDHELYKELKDLVTEAIRTPKTPDK